jgi:hypothetical protein
MSQQTGSDGRPMVAKRIIYPFGPLRQALRALVLSEGCPLVTMFEVRFLRQLPQCRGCHIVCMQSEDKNKNGFLEIAVVVSLLQRHSISCSDDDILMLLQRFKLPSSPSLVDYRRLFAALETSPPQGYMNPATTTSQLPHPYSMVQEMVQELFAAAWHRIQLAQRDPSLQQYRSTQQVQALALPQPLGPPSKRSAFISVSASHLLRVAGHAHVLAWSVADSVGPACTFSAFPPPRGWGRGGVGGGVGAKLPCLF